MGKNLFDIRMRPGNDVDRNDFTDDFRRSRTGIDGCLDGTDVTTDHDRDQTGPDFFIADECYIGCFDHRVSCFDRADQTFCFYHT